MRANRAYELLHTRGSLRPALIAGDDRHDLVEIVAIDDGEVVLFWELPAREAGRLLRHLRTDLASLGAEEFLDRWRDADAPA